MEICVSLNSPARAPHDVNFSLTDISATSRRHRILSFIRETGVMEIQKKREIYLSDIEHKRKTDEQRRIFFYYLNRLRLLCGGAGEMEEKERRRGIVTEHTFLELQISWIEFHFKLQHKKNSYYIYPRVSMRQLQPHSRTKRRRGWRNEDYWAWMYESAWISIWC